MKNLPTKFQVATAVAVFFHLIGLVGILFFNRDFFVRATPFNLFLSFALLIWTQPGKNLFFILFVALVGCIGFAVEVVGVNTGLLFGSYRYGAALGWQWLDVPFIIGINWIIVICCCGISTHTLLTKASAQLAPELSKPMTKLKAVSVIVDGATLAVIFDWLMEPVAVKLGYWTWLDGGEIPSYNYFCWFVISALLLALFHFLPFRKENKFAVNLLLIQGMFFLVLRTFLD